MSVPDVQAFPQLRRQRRRGSGFVRSAAFLSLIIGAFMFTMALRAGLFDFSFLSSPAGFQIGQSFIAFSSTDSVAWALIVGLSNTLIVSAISLAFGTFLGFATGILQLSRNPAVRILAHSHVNLIRGVPLLLWLFLWYSLLLTQLPPARTAMEVLPHIFVSNEGMSVPLIRTSRTFLVCALALLAVTLVRWTRRFNAHPKATRILFIICLLAVCLSLVKDFAIDYPTKARFRVEGGLRITTEFTALLVGITFAASSAVAEIVRAAFLAIPSGQLDAARALGLSWLQGMRLVVLPQALATIMPPLTGAYASLIKATSLSVAIGFPDLVMVSNTVINQTGRAIECTSIFTLSYLLISIGISSLTKSYFGRRY